MSNRIENICLSKLQTLSQKMFRNKKLKKIYFILLPKIKMLKDLLWKLFEKKSKRLTAIQTETLYESQDIKDIDIKLSSKMKLLEQLVSISSEFTVKIEDVLKESDVLSNEDQQNIIEKIKKLVIETITWTINKSEYEDIKPLLESKVADLNRKINELKINELDKENDYEYRKKEYREEGQGISVETESFFQPRQCPHCGKIFTWYRGHWWALSSARALEMHKCSARI